MSAIARLVCVPNGCPSRSATMSIFGGPRRARQQMSRGASSCIVKMIVLAAGVMDMGADRPRCALMFAYGFDIWCRWVRIWCVCVAARPLDRVLSESWCRRLLGCRVPGRGSCTVCRARGDDQPVLIETTVSATQSATQVHSVHCQPAVTSGESVSLRWRQVGRLRVGGMAFPFAQWQRYRPASHSDGRARATHDVPSIFTCLSHAKEQQHPGCRRQWCNKAHAAQRVSTCPLPLGDGDGDDIPRAVLYLYLSSPRLTTPLPNLTQLTFHPVTPQVTLTPTTSHRPQHWD
jgi:hypothetical protein